MPCHFPRASARNVTQAKYSGQILIPRRKRNRGTFTVSLRCSSRWSCRPMRKPERTKNRSTPVQPYRKSVNPQTEDGASSAPPTAR